MFKVCSTLKFSAVICSMAFAWGCGMPSEDSETSLQMASKKELSQGINLFATEGMISGAYRKADHAIFFETHRGAPRQEFYKSAYPELGAYELDVRVLDDNGRVVYVQQGGDALDPAWAMALAREDDLPPVNPLRRAEDLELVKEWASAMEQLEIPAALASEKRALVQTQLAVRDELLKPIVAASVTAVVETPSANQVAIHKEPVLGGEHSAHFSKKGSYLLNACNHGNCAAAMPQKCRISTPAYVQYGDSSCSTPYFPTSAWGFHNCHDDTMRGVWGMRLGSQGGSGDGVCVNAALHVVAPDCTTTVW